MKERFSYETGTAATERDYIRFAIDDVKEGSGPKPESENFTDEELDMMLGVEGTWQRAVAACYEALHAAWATHVSWQGDGLSVSMSHAAMRWNKLAEYQRKRFGGATGATGRSRTFIKVDGYSQDIAATEVDDVTY